MVDEDIVYSPNKYRETEGMIGDRIKGIVARPLPKKWINISANKLDDENCELNRKIAAELKPYFFIYRYSQLSNEYNKYMRSVESNCKSRFGKNLDELSINASDQEEHDFYVNYQKYMPISKAPGTMNRICWAIEREFPTLDMFPRENFDYSILKSDAQYSDDEFLEIGVLYDEYCNRVQLLMKGREHSESANSDADLEMLQLKRCFADAASQACPNEKVLANIVLDLCYRSNKMKTFAWDVCGETIVDNLLEKSGHRMQYLERSENGDYVYSGEHFILKSIQRGTSYDIE